MFNVENSPILNLDSMASFDNLNVSHISADFSLFDCNTLFDDQMMDSSSDDDFYNIATTTLGMSRSSQCASQSAPMDIPHPVNTCAVRFSTSSSPQSCHDSPASPLAVTSYEEEVQECSPKKPAAKKRRRQARRCNSDSEEEETATSNSKMVSSMEVQPAANCPVIKALVDEFVKLTSSVDSICSTVKHIYKFNGDSSTLAADTVKHACTVNQTLIEKECEIEKIYSTVCLNSNDLYLIENLRYRVQVLKCKVALYCYEAAQCVDRSVNLPESLSSPRPAIGFLIERQPFPNVIRQHTQIREDEMVLRVIVGATVQFSAVSRVKASVVVEQTAGNAEDAGYTGKNMLGHDVQNLDLEEMAVKFPLKFLEGTRKTPARVGFSFQASFVQCGGKQQMTTTIESPLTNIFLIMTNQRQYEYCEKLLLQRAAALPGSNKITYASFANALQMQFLRSTRQSLANASRPLSSYDFAYFKKQYFAKNQMESETSPVSEQSLNNFWNWYSKALQALRYQRHMSQLWEQGFIYGFMSRTDAAIVLESKGVGPGSFLVRFSESHPGQFAIAYTATRGKVHHYLVKENETAGAKITLCDFLQGVVQWRTIMRYRTDSNNVANLFEPMDKDTALGPYYHTKYSNESTGAYEQILPIKF